MKPIPLNFLTMYADLAQNVRRTSLEHGSVVTRIKKGIPYLYVVAKNGATRVEKYIGRADDPDAQHQAADLRQAAQHARALRTTVSALKQARIPAPTLALGRVVEAMANADLFDQGVVLIETAAFQTYAGIVGYYLPDATLITNDADILVASFSATSEPKDLETILKNANPTFRAQMHFDDRLPRIFKSDDGFAVNVLTKFGRGRKIPILLDDLGCSAEAMKFMEYLAEENMDAVVLYGSGVLVKVAPPLRFAIHKLLIAPERRGRFVSKRLKDLGQARDLIDIYLKIDSAALEDALDEARSRGTKWKKNINASLREIGLDARTGYLPRPVTKF